MKTVRTRFKMPGYVAGLCAGVLLSAAACGEAPTAQEQASLDNPGIESTRSSLTASAIQKVFIVMMENQNASDVYRSANAPYINQLMKDYGYASNFVDVLPSYIPSEPHYVWLEAGTSSFADYTFKGDADPSAKNSTSSTAHLVNLLERAGISWTSYQEGVDASTGACPVASNRTTAYAAKHNPFLFFRDVAGNPPSKTSARCVSHSKSLSQLSADLRSGSVSSYNLITPTQCHDMHGATGCPSGSPVKAGDDFLRGLLPSLISYAAANKGLILLTWDEPEGALTQPFVVVAPHLKSAGYESRVRYDLSSVLKSVQQIFQVTPLLGHAADPSTTNLSDFFQAGFFP